MRTPVPYFVREYQASDFPLILSWWNAHGKRRDAGVLIPGVLPACGVIAHHADGRDLAALFLVETRNNPAAQLEWAFSAPGLNHFVVADALLSCARVLTDIARDCGYCILNVKVDRHFRRVLEANGWVFRDTPVYSGAFVIPEIPESD